MATANRMGAGFLMTLRSSSASRTIMPGFPRSQPTGSLTPDQAGSRRSPAVEHCAKRSRTSTSRHRMKPMTSAGGWKAIGYTVRTAQRVGWVKLWRAMRSRNACKTCGLGMGGQMGGNGQRSGAVPRGLQEVAAGHGGRHASRDLGRVLHALLDRPAAVLVAARAGSVRPAGHADLRRSRRLALPRSSAGTRRSHASARS